MVVVAVASSIIALVNIDKLLVDPGEASSIALPVRQASTCLTVDEKRGRKISRDLGIDITGLLGLMVLAKQKGVIPRGLPLIEALRAVEFRVSDAIVAVVKEKLGE